MFDYAGCIHFHSAYSYDAFEPIERIIASALRSGLDFAVVTDHFNLDAKKNGFERYHEAQGRKMLLLVGEEISPRYNHYLAMNISEPVMMTKADLHSQDTIDAVNARGGFGFIAHPTHSGAPFAGIRAYPWVDWNVKDFAGISIWDLIGDWTSQCVSPWGLICAVLNTTGAIRGPKTETLQKWDELTQRGRYVAIGEIDNHATRKRMGIFSKRIFPFNFAFRTVRTHVLLEQPVTGQCESDKAAIYAALRSGCSYVSFDYWQSPTGFQFEMFDGKQRTRMGGRITRSGPTLLEIKLPAPGRIRLIRNGRMIRQETSRTYMERDVDVAGVYRVEVDLKVRGAWRPWIYSNPIWVD
jgi:hypothetical protein